MAGDGATRNAAVVIGAGIAGLVAAAVLAHRFGTVTLLDRDPLEDVSRPRPNVPQSGQPHVMLMAGLNGLEELFPGIGAELMDLGAVELDPCLDMRIYRGRLFPLVPSGLRIVCFSRPLLEVVLHRRLRGFANVVLRDGSSVTGLTGSADRVTGVVLADGGTLAADLVLDASGRSAGRSERWLADLGLPTPDVSVVKVDVGYTSAFFTRRPGDLTGAKLLFTVPLAPTQKRFGMVVPVEGDRYLIGLGGWHGEHAPTEPEGFAEFARSLPDPAVAAVLDRAERLTDLVRCQFPGSRRRHFEKLRQVPAGYLVLGDALCSVNPVYGQGMSCAVGEALVLGRALDRRPGVSADLARGFYRAAAKRVIVTPWQFAAGGDHDYPETGGRQPFGIRLFNRYANRINDAIMVSPDLQITMAKVQHLLLPPTVVFRPSIVYKVLRSKPPLSPRS